MNEVVLYFFGALLFGGMIAMLIASTIAKSWLTTNTGYQPSRAAAFFLGPILTSFGPMKTYAEVRRSRNLPTTLSTVFWVGTSCWGLGIVGFFGALFSSVH